MNSPTSSALIDAGAHQAATGHNPLPEPTAAQKAAGNYRLGRIVVQGLRIAVENPRGTYREGVDADGVAWRCRMAAHYGYLSGTRGADGDGVDVFVGPAPESGRAWVINQVLGGQFDEHKVMLGFVDEAHARAAYLSSYSPGWQGLGDIVPASIDQIRWWLRWGDMARPLSPDQLPHAESESTSIMDRVTWTLDAQPHGMSLGKLLYNLRTDASGDPDLLMDAVTMDDLMQDPSIEQILMLDALVVEVGMMQRKMEQLQGLLMAAGQTVKPTGMEIGEPVRARGVLQIPVLFTMDDGQTLAVWFHNPDSTPAKMTPMDALTSWKWQINKKDVTIVVAPERGTDLQPRVVARRIMALVEKNSPAFQRANARTAEKAAQIEALKGEVSGLEATLADLTRRVAIAKEEKLARDAAKPAAATSGRTVDLGNNESRFIGVSPNPDGTFTAMTGTASKTFKTLAGAQRWIDQRGQGAAAVAAPAAQAQAAPGLTDAQRQSIGDEIVRTQNLLAKERQFSTDTQKPVAISWYESHLSNLTDVLNGRMSLSDLAPSGQGPIEDWDTTRAVLEARGAAAAAAPEAGVAAAMPSEDPRAKSDPILSGRAAGQALDNDWSDYQRIRGEEVAAANAASAAKLAEVDRLESIMQANSEQMRSIRPYAPKATASADVVAAYEAWKPLAASALQGLFAPQPAPSVAAWAAHRGRAESLGIKVVGADTAETVARIKAEAAAKFKADSDARLAAAQAKKAESSASEPPAADLFGDTGPAPLAPEGAESKVKTAKGTEVVTGYTVVEADSLITSHNPATGDANPAFPAELQPRDRGRDASIAWVRKTAQDLDPDLLGKSRRADSGAPIVGPDGVVESGNGRTMAVVLAYQTGKADDYRAWLTEEAAYFGLKPEKVAAMRRPVLVRVRTSEVDRVAFAVEANQDDKLAMTATEVAKADAGRLTDDVVALMTDDGDLTAAANVPFLAAFLRSLGDAEAARYSTSDGKPTASLIARVQAAIFAKAYQDDRLLELTADVAKPEIANIVKALNHAAPEFIQAAALDPAATGAATGQLTDAVEKSLNQQAVDALLGASNVIRQAKEAGQTVDEFVKQSGLFGDIDPSVAAMAVFISQNNRSAKRMGEAFKAMATFIRGEVQRRQTADMFGDNAPVDFKDIVAAANRELERLYGEGAQTIGLFEPPATEPAGPAQAAAAEPEPSPAEAVDAVYRFDDATDEFKASLADSVGEADYSPFTTAVAIDRAVKERGGTVSWALVPGAILDSAPPDDEDDDDGFGLLDGVLILDGDFKGHPFRGNQYGRGSSKSSNASRASREAKRAERKAGGHDRVMQYVHSSAAHAHQQAAKGAKGKTRAYHAKMAKFHGQRAQHHQDKIDGKLVLDGVAHADPAGMRWPDDGLAIMDAAAAGDPQGVIRSGGKVLGRAVIAGDGKAMIYVGTKGKTRVQFENGEKAMWSDDDAVDMVKALFAGKTNPAAPASTSTSAPNLSTPAMNPTVPASTTPAPSIKQTIGKTDVASFIPKAQLATMLKLERGEEGQFFRDKVKDLADLIAAMPATYGQDGKGDQAVAYLHYFSAGADWYITEKDMDGGIDQAFGLADLGDGGEIGYISIRELTSLSGVELDLHWTPKTLGQIRGAGQGAQGDGVALPQATDPARAADIDFLRSIIAKTGDYASDASLERLEALLSTYDGDAEVQALATQAADVVQEAIVADAQSALAG